MASKIKVLLKSLVKTELFPYIHAIRFLPQCSLFKTIYYNFKLFPFRQAIKLPFAVGKNVKIVNEGSISINTQVVPFMVVCGIVTIPPFEDYDTKTKITNYGTMIIGNNVNIHPGARIWVDKKAVLELKGYNIIGAESKVACHKEIVIGLYSGFSWNCEVFDTDFHYTKDVVSGKIYAKDKPIIIGDNVFIGNHVNIGKGTKLANGSVVSSWSNLSGSYIKKGENALISGVKATVIDTGYYIAHGYKMYLDDQFAKEFKKTQDVKN